MPIIYADAKDGLIHRPNRSTFTDAREGTTGTVSDSIAYSTNTIRAEETSSRGRTYYHIGRSFYAFDVSSVTTAVSSIDLKIHGFSNNSYPGGLIVVRSDAFGGDTMAASIDALVSGDFNAIHGWDGASGMGAYGQATAWSGSFSTGTWSTSGYNTIPLTSAVQTVAVTQDWIFLAIVDYSYDYSKVTPPGSWPSNQDNRIGGYYADGTGTSKDPYLDITLGTHGYPHYVNTVGGVNIDKVNTTLRGNIVKINTVD
jgi:hypothetical protein